MNLTKSSLSNPAGVAVGVAIVVVFGLFSLSKLPVQLFPDIEEPRLGIWTGWRAASPAEIESEILEPQEEVFQGIPGLKIMDTNANPGGSWVGLTFDLNTDMQATLVDVIGRLNRLPPLPRDADPPVVNLGGGGGGGANEALSWFFIQLLPGNENPIDSYERFVEDVIAPRIEAVPGVAGVDVMAGADRELQIRFDPYRAAELGVQIPQVAAIAGGANDVSGGFHDVGRRQYTLRFVGRYTPEELSQLVLEWRDGMPVRLGDIADISIRRGDRNEIAIQNNNPAMAIRVDREVGANVLEALNGVKEVVEELRAGPLKEKGLTMQQSFDASVFIYRAIGPGHEQSGHRYSVGNRRLVVVSPADAGHPSRGHRDPRLASGDIYRAQHHRSNAQCHFSCRTCFCGRNGAGCRDRCLGEHRSTARRGCALARGLATWKPTGLGCLDGLDRNHSGDLFAGHLSQGRRRSALCGSRSDHCDCGLDFVDRRGNDLAHRGEKVARQREPRRPVMRGSGTVSPTGSRSSPIPLAVVIC